jgi:hypothetical protein
MTIQTKVNQPIGPKNRRFFSFLKILSIPKASNMPLRLAAVLAIFICLSLLPLQPIDWFTKGSMNGE